MTTYMPSRIPFLVSGFYVALLVLLFAFALIQDGYDTLPLLYVTIPLSVVLKNRSSDVYLAILEGGVANTIIIYLLFKVFTRAKPKRKYSSATK
jgi:hypothetical protein